MMFLLFISLILSIIYLAIRGTKWHEDVTALAHSGTYLSIIVIAAVILLVYLFIINGAIDDLWPSGYSDSDFFSKFIDPWIAILTFLIAAIIGLMNMRRQWEDSLPHTVTIHYCHQDRIYASFYDAKVISENDIRDVAQSLGRDINGGRNLKLTSYNTLIGPHIERTHTDKADANNHYIKRWLYVMRLNGAPDFQFITSIEKTEEVQKNTIVRVEYMAFTIDEDVGTKYPIKGYYVKASKESNKQINFEESYWRDKAIYVDVKETFIQYKLPENSITINDYLVHQKP